MNKILMMLLLSVSTYAGAETLTNAEYVQKYEALKSSANWRDRSMYEKAQKSLPDKNCQRVHRVVINDKVTWLTRINFGGPYDSTLDNPSAYRYVNPENSNDIIEMYLAVYTSFDFDHAEDRIAYETGEVRVGASMCAVLFNSSLGTRKVTEYKDRIEVTAYKNGQFIRYTLRTNKDRKRLEVTSID